MSRQNIGRTSRWLATRAVAGILLGMAALAPETADGQTKTAISVSASETADAQTRTAISVSASETSVVGDGVNQVTISFTWTGTISEFPEESFDFEILDPSNGFDLSGLSINSDNSVRFASPGSGMGPITLTLTTRALSPGDASRTLTVTILAFAGSPYAADSTRWFVRVKVTAPPAAEPLPVVTVTATSPHPGPRDLVFTLSRTGSTASSLPVNIALTGNQDAYSNSAWNSRPSMATFDMGESTTQVVVGTRSQRDDQLPITLTVEPGSGYEVGDPGAVTVLVGEPLRTMRMARATGQAATASEGDTVRFSLTLDAAATEEFSSHHILGDTGCGSTADANLIAEDDIQSGTLSVSVSWAIGDREKTITVVTLEDNLNEPDEWICLGVDTNPSDILGAFKFAGSENIPVTLNNVDPGPEVSVRAESASVVGDGTNEVVISLSWTGNIATTNSFVFDLEDANDAIDSALEGTGITQAVTSATGPQAFRFTTNMLADGAASRRVTFTLKDGDGYSVASGMDSATVTVTAPAAPPQNMLPNGNVLISNIGQGDGGARRPGLNSYAQGFVTGDNNGGYTLSSIVLYVSSLSDFDDTVDMVVTINEATGAVPSASVLATLTNPASYVVGSNEFTASGTVTLAKDTRYFIVVRQNVRQGGMDWMRVNPNDNALDSGAASGWSIDDEHLTHTGNQRAGWGTQPTRAMKIQVRGSAGTLIINNVAVGSPMISGIAEVGEELTAVPGTITDSDGGAPTTESGFNYQWQRETASGTWEDVSGATSISYTLDMADLGLKIRVLVSFTDSLSNDEVLASAPTTAVAAASDDPVPPAVTVTAVARSVVGGQENAVFTLTRTGGDLASPLMVAISVTGSGVSNTPALPTTATFAENMATVVVSVTTNSVTAGTSSQEVSLTIEPSSEKVYTVGSASMATVSVEPIPSGDAPEITGTAKVGETLTSTAGTIADPDGLPAPPAYTYQWQRQDDISGWTDISEATSATYALVTADRYRKIRVIFRFMDDMGNAETRISAPYPSGAATVEPIDNVAATGQPTISGMATVGVSLTVSTMEIMDTNGLTGAIYQYQWQRADAGQVNWTDIADATSSAYTVAAADEGSILRVTVSFRDEDRYPESRSSAPTSTVAVRSSLAYTVTVAPVAAVEPAFGESATAGNRLVFTVTPVRAPDEQTEVTYSFSGTAEEGLDYEAHARKTLSFSSGSTAPEQIMVTAIGDIVAEGDRGESVIVTVGDSTATGTINDPPAQISIGTATPSITTKNGATVVSFTFSALSGPAPAGGFDVEWRVVVDSNAGNALGRSAVARATAACTVRSCGGTVTFAASSTTLAAPVIDAEFDTELAVDTVVQVQIKPPAAAANLAVVPSPDVSASEQIADSEWVVAGVTTIVAETPAALVYAVAVTGRTAATEIVESVWRRADARRARHLQSHAMLGGRVLDARALSSGDAERTVREVASLLGLKASDPGDSLEAVDSGYSYGGDIDDYRAWAEIPDASRIASASSFALPYGHGADDGSFVIWGEYSVTSNESVPVAGAFVDAQSSSMTLGFDIPVGGKTLLGLALSRSSGETDYRETADDPYSTIETSLTSFAPYIHRTMSSGLGVWGSFGMGSGTLTSTAGNGSVDTDVSLQLLAGGARSEVGSFAGGRLSLKGDAIMTSTEVEQASSSTDSFAAVDAGTTRARLALELSGNRKRASGSNIFLQAELGARLDSGDADEGSGADMAVVIDYVIPGLGLEMRAQSSMMLLHSQEGFEEMGFGFGAIYDPGIAGHGVRLSLEPTWNAPRTGAAESMWGAQSLDGHAASDIGAALNARLGYGAETRRVRALSTLYCEAETGEEDWRLRLGAELRGLDGPLERLSLDIYGEREESRLNSPHSAVMLEGRLGF